MYKYNSFKSSSPLHSDETTCSKTNITSVFGDYTIEQLLVGINTTKPCQYDEDETKLVTFRCIDDPDTDKGKIDPIYDCLKTENTEKLEEVEADEVS